MGKGGVEPVSPRSRSPAYTATYDALGQRRSYTDATGNLTTIGYDIDGRVTSIDDGKGTTGYTWDSGTEHRGLLTGEDIGAGGAPSTFTASYDAAGLSSLTYPNGLVASYSSDNAGNLTALTYSKAGTTWLAFAQAVNAEGQLAQQTSPESHQTFGYDGSGRLTSVQDTTLDGGSAACATREYAFDDHSNRTSLDTYPDGGTDPTNGDCSTATTPTIASSSYDQADRLTNSGYSYDALGRTLTVPASDAQGIGSHVATTGPLSIGYDANDMVASEAQGTSRLSFTLDVDHYRIRSVTDGSTTTTNHYSDSGDSPSWVSTGPTSWTRNVSGIDGNLAATIAQDGSVTLQLANPHGDLVATAADDSGATGPDSYTESTEYGQPRNPAAAPNTYGWLGSKQRSADDLGGLTLMGVRLYDSATGRFLTVDPVVGGNANAYIYPTDPNDGNDLTGRSGGFDTCLCGDGFLDVDFMVNISNEMRVEGGSATPQNIGRAVETRVRDITGTELKERGFETSAGRQRYYDGASGKLRIEVKYTNKVWLSTQIEDEIKNAEDKHLNFRLYVKAGVGIPDRLKERMEDAGFKIVRMHVTVKYV